MTAAVAYMEAGGERRHIARLIRYFGDKALAEIDQAAIDEAAIKLFPRGAPDYRNRAVYTPISAILHHRLGDKCPAIRRPKGSKGRQRTAFLWPDDAFKIIGEAEKIDAEFGLYLRLLISTGIRKGEGLKLLRQDVQPEARMAWLWDSKNEDPRMLRLRQDLVGPLEVHIAATDGHRLFRFHDGGHFKHLLTRARMAASGLPCPVRRPVKWREPPHSLRFASFHIFRHSWATWFRIYAGGDVEGLVATRNWRDPRSAARYAHVVARAEWERVDDMPGTGTGRGKKTA
ncbi:MAG TPA: tyrosine-type recombinase/integrase [Candidatus Cybelea sp.]|nr:tyrosine-type recombinase/integrase [Candidatus Cybelea sp.]